MNRFIKTLIIINGILIPIFLGYLFFGLIKDLRKQNDYSYEDEEGIIIGERLEDAKKDSLALQYIFYETPEKIYNSSNFYMPIHVSTYEKAMDLKKNSLAAGDVNFNVLTTTINVIFLDKDYKIIGKLLDKKASIKDIEIPYRYREDEIDKTVKNIAYLIGFKDSNNDGYLDSKDCHDLYISDLNGQNLVQVTENVDIEHYEFIKAHSQIFISYKIRDGKREEYRKVEFAIYDIKSYKLNQLSDLNSELKKIEQKLIN